jgi:hypothetical protein
MSPYRASANRGAAHSNNYCTSAHLWEAYALPSFARAFRIALRHFGRIGSILRTCKGARGDRVGPLQIHVRYRLPSCRRHRWLQTQPPNNSLHPVVNALMGAFTKAVPRTRAEPLRSPLSRLRAPIRLWPSSANVKPGCAPRRANDRHDISDLEFRRNQRLSVDELTIGRNSTFRNTTNAVAIAAHAPPARTPMAADHHRIASIETADVQAFPKNRARPAGTDTG